MAEETRIPAFCTQCRSRCGCDAVVADGRLLRIEPLSGHPSGEKLCPKGRAAPELVYHPDRLTTPLRRTSPKGAPATWRPIGWDEALDEIAGHMARIRDAHAPEHGVEHGAEQVAFSVTTPSGTHISDGISWIERFIRAFGSPNTIYSTEICNWHKDFASRLTYGSDIGTPDFANAGTILLWGHNPAATWLARSVELQKALRRGARLVVVDPRPTLYARRADAWLRVRPGTDQALALGMAHLMLTEGRFDAAFAREWTNAALLVRQDTGGLLRESDLALGGSAHVLLAGAGVGAELGAGFGAGAGAGTGGLLAYDAAAGAWRDPPADAALFDTRTVETADGPMPCRSALALFAEVAAEWPPGRVAAVTGVPEEHLRQTVDLLSGSGPLAYYAWNGVGQSATATQTDRAISILYGLTGHYGAPGGNVPGGAAPFDDISGQDLLDDRQLAKTLGLAERPLGPGRRGWVTARDAYRAILTHEPYPVRMLVSFGGNLLSAQPDSRLAQEALARLEFHVHADFFLNATAEHADIVLPVATSWEREGLRTGFDASLEGMRRVQLRPAAIAPVGQARGDTEIVLDLARRLGLADAMFGCDVDRGHAHVLAPSGVTMEALRAAPEGVTLPAGVPLHAYREHGFPTPTRRLEIYSEQMLEHGIAPIPSLSGVSGSTLETDAPLAEPGRPLRLGCAKTVAYCHSQGRNIASLRRLVPDPVLELAPETAQARGIAESDWVRITTRSGSFVARARLVEGLAPDAVFAQHGWTAPDMAELPAAGTSSTGGDRLAANMNGAVPTDRTDPVSGSIPLRCTACEVARL